MQKTTTIVTALLFGVLATAFQARADTPAPGLLPLETEAGLPETAGDRQNPPVRDAAGLAPIAVAPLGEDQLAVLGSAGRRLLLLDRANCQLRRTIRLPAEASGMAVRDRLAYVTTQEPAGRLLEIDLDRERIQRSWRVGHMPTAPLLDSQGDTVYLANRFEHRVRAIELANGVQTCVEVIREPVALALGPNEKHLFVANHLPLVRPFLDDENPTMYAEVSVVEARTMQAVCHIELPNGSQNLRGMALSPGGDYVVVSHVLSNFVLPTMAVAGGAMNRSAISLIRTDWLDRYATLILDDPHRGAANPWAVCFSASGKNLVVSHAGTREISVIAWAALLERAAARSGTANLFDARSLNDMAGLRRRVALPLDGPRAVCGVGSSVYVAGYFSDNLVDVDGGGKLLPCVGRMGWGENPRSAPAGYNGLAWASSTSTTPRSVFSTGRAVRAVIRMVERTRCTGIC
jgi:hypothetical protein